MLDRIRKILEKEKCIVFAYIFGSYTKSPKYSNDLDIGIFVKNKVKSHYELELGLRIEKKIKIPVDVVVLNDKPLLLLSEVLRSGKLILSKDDRRRVSFETKIMNDVLKFNDLMEEFDKKRFERYGIR
jgi:predicted nucleotidyltransferase